MAQAMQECSPEPRQHSRVPPDAPPVRAGGQAHAPAGSPVAHRLAAVRRRIAEAARRAGRSGDEIVLVAVTKGVEPERIREAWSAGQRIFGENRVQELAAKAAALADLPLEWHMVGHLQRNKARDVARIASVLHSLDSLRLAVELDRRLEAAGRHLRVLVEVNVSGEPGKFGVAPSDALELVRAVAERCPHLKVEGLMAIGPNVPDELAIRGAFRRLRELLEEIRQKTPVGPAFRHLSMGMSSDFEWAIEEGATMVRIGTAIFGPRAR